MPENTEAMPEISASPAPQDAKPADTGEKKQKKPRNTSGMKPPLNQLPPEEAFAIRSKGGKAAAKKRREEKLVKDALLNLLTKPQHKKKGGKAHYKASAELTSYDDVFSENTTLMVQMLIPLIQSAINGNIDSLFAILRVLGQEPGTPGQFGVDEFTPPEPPTEGAGGPGKTEPASDPNAEPGRSGHNHKPGKFLHSPRRIPQRRRPRKGGNMDKRQIFISGHTVSKRLWNPYAGVRGNSGCTRHTRARFSGAL